MAELGTLIADAKTSYAILAGLSLVAILLTVIADRASFRRFLGRLNPLLVILVTVALAFILLTLFLMRGWFVIYRADNLNGLLLAIGLAAVIVLPIIQVDRTVKFPQTLNIPFPQSMLFYPAIAYLVEVVFHLLPLALLTFGLTALLPAASPQTIIIACIIVVAAIEPVYQTVGFAGRYPAWSVAYTALHVFVINLAQLCLFRQYDFVTMLAFRLAYYLAWHILWGHLRLKWLYA
ncbi:MAG: hypothetical protein K8I60_14060 [Anaerolineae bacterium]|nr:hypothetical protein [Anaerolineae bacterium]